MAVKICMKNGRCLTCDTASFEDVSESVATKGDFFCCPGKTKKDDFQFCIRKSEIVSWERTSTRPADDDADPKDPANYRVGRPG